MHVKKISFDIDEFNAGKRLDAFLAAAPESEVSRSYAKTLIEEGKVLVNGSAAKVSHKLKSGEKVELEIPEPQALDLQAENIPLDVVYEDEHLMVINKQAGLTTHPAPGLYSGTLVNAVLYHAQQEGSRLSDINGILRPGIVHRLDKDTTGLIVVAKSNEAHQNLAEQIKSRNCSRIYTALVQGYVKKEKSTIDRPIGRHPKERYKMTSFSSLTESVDARHARTHYRVIERINFKQHDYTLVEAKLDTGRTHQIRVHMSWLRHPVIGDITYQASKKTHINVARPLLHSSKLSFDHPITHERMSFDAPLPEDFRRVLDIVRGTSS